MYEKMVRQSQISYQREQENKRNTKRNTLNNSNNMVGKNTDRNSGPRTRNDPVNFLNTHFNSTKEVGSNELREILRQIEKPGIFDKENNKCKKLKICYEFTKILKEFQNQKTKKTKLHIQTF